jgi:hypothetical protein
MRPCLRRAASAIAIVVFAAGLGACASAVHTPDHVTTIVAREAAPKASHLQNVGVVAIVDHFKLGMRPNDSALVANGNDRMNTLMPAILARLPAYLARDAIRAEAVTIVPGRPEANARALARYDYVMEFKPVSVSQQRNTDPSLTLSVRVLNHALQPIWVARVELRTDAMPEGQREDIREWREAMADDLSGLLLHQLGEDGFVAAPAL